ncbi:hypothetical protein AX16_003065 [Volvariella volvacea WC 439]|nr:hypothetical protein AX16_003065 [Volvariella volvacea WC 439]
MLLFALQSLGRDFDSWFKPFNGTFIFMEAMVFATIITALSLFLAKCELSASAWVSLSSSNCAPRRQVHFGPLYVYQLPPSQVDEAEPIPVSIMSLPSDDTPSPKFGGRPIIRRPRKRCRSKSRLRRHIPESEESEGGAWSFISDTIPTII